MSKSAVVKLTACVHTPSAPNPAGPPVERPGRTA